MLQKRLTRRNLLSLGTVIGTGALLAACAPKVVEVEKEVTRVVKEVVEKVVTAPPATPAPKEKVTLMHWFWSDDPYQTSLHTDSFDRFRERFPEITIKTDIVVNVAEHKKKLLTVFAAGADMPDTSEGQGGWLPEMFRAKMVVPLDERIRIWEYGDDLVPSVAKMARGAPTDPMGIMVNKVQVHYTYYRADWFAEAGLEPPDTQDELLERAKALNDPPNRYGYGVRGGDGGSFGYQLGHYWKGNGVDVLKDDGTVDIDSPEAIATVEWFLSFNTEHKVAQPSALSDRFPELFALLQGGKIAIFTHGLWSWKTQSDALGDKVSAVMKVKGKVRRWVSSGVEGPMMFTTCKQQDEAWEFISFLAEPSEALIWSKERGAGPPFVSMEGEAIYRENRFFKAALESAPYWGQFPFWNEKWPKFSDMWTPQFQMLWNEEITPEEFCKRLAEVLREG